MSETKTVPVEPTKRMMQAGAGCIRSHGHPSTGIVPAIECYAAMLAAAPTNPPEVPDLSELRALVKKCHRPFQSEHALSEYQEGYLHASTVITDELEALIERLGDGELSVPEPPPPAETGGSDREY